ncbi:Spindle-body formation-associated protein [Penicillium hispanicum]|uniref:Spindle-body formation-associated protein n=1 Tax=Penicillium hispanicum TaxID=1080232 RepID=UPI00253F6F84|nr:Spindle-body formation-associated protein [Penicillium hispanicum]KAJ5573631.1 Spindle-body formation-associated protein [Penicillium hispanicum]
MLDWMKGNEGADAADTSKVLEPPETPAPVFAIRAFKSALFGTPGADEETEASASQPEQAGHQRSQSDATNPIPIEKKENANAEVDTTVNPSGSPTKSILVTPGTISNRRKTVSFGEGVVDNEGKRDSHSSKVVKTPPNPSGNLTAQWMSGSADGKPRSKLTQTLMDARDNASKNAESAGSSLDASSKTNPDPRSQSKDELGSEDTTLNLDEPRSESGKYWKTEFDAYRVRTNREIKKLIHYRSIAKSYARKKDTEALRLADKLKEEEEKVADMERQVSRLASTIVGEGSKADKEQLIQDLTKQTTLALQYKQQVTSLRKLLESQGVVGADATKNSEPNKEKSPAEKPSDELRKTQQELKQANAKIEEMKRQSTDLSTLQGLAESSEKKAQELEKENHSLKQTLARVKQEMSRYEGRRKEKENKLKQREAKLETRIQEYRERLKNTTQEHRESEEALRNGFDEERRRMQAQVDLLKMRVTATERVPPLRPQQRHSFSPRKEYTGVQVQDFGGQDHPEIEDEATEDIEAPPSPSPRSKAREARHTRNATTGAIDLKRVTRDVTADDDEVTHYLNEILPKPNHRSRQVDLDPVPPSSPPNIGSLRSPGRPTLRYHPAGDNQRTYRSLYIRDPNDSASGYLHTNRPRTHIKSTLDTISGVPSSRSGAYAGYTISSGEHASRRHGLLDMESKFLSPERAAAAKSRLKQKHDSRRAQALGKENLRAGGAGANEK